MAVTTLFSCDNAACPCLFVAVKGLRASTATHMCPSCHQPMMRSEETRYSADCGDYTLTVVPE